jgi:hypothetical protein
MGEIATVRPVHVGFGALPLLTSLIAVGLAARLGGSAVRRFTPAKPFWALGLLLFAAGAAAEAYGVADGWGEVSFKAYYLAGGCLTVAFLGAGSAWLALPRDLALVVTGALAAAAAGATVTVLLADVDATLLAAAPVHEPPANDALTGHAFLWAVVLNGAGTVLLIGAALVSLIARRRVRANVLVIAGVALVAVSGTLTRLGSYGYVFVGQMLGLVLLAAGFELATRRRSGASRPRRRGLGVTPLAETADRR